MEMRRIHKGRRRLFKQGARGGIAGKKERGPRSDKGSAETQTKQAGQNNGVEKMRWGGHDGRRITAFFLVTFKELGQGEGGK